jgi:hypothetical protein
MTRATGCRLIAIPARDRRSSLRNSAVSTTRTALLLVVHCGSLQGAARVGALRLLQQCNVAAARGRFSGTAATRRSHPSAAARLEPAQHLSTRSQSRECQSRVVELTACRASTTSAKPLALGVTQLRLLQSPPLASTWNAQVAGCVSEVSR